MNIPLFARKISLVVLIIFAFNAFDFCTGAQKVNYMFRRTLITTQHFSLCDTTYHAICFKSEGFSVLYHLQNVKTINIRYKCKTVSRACRFFHTVVSLLICAFAKVQKYRSLKSCTCISYSIFLLMNLFALSLFIYGIAQAISRWHMRHNNNREYFK